MLNKINSFVFYLTLLLFVSTIVVYFMGFIEIIDALNYVLTLFGFIGLTLGLKLTKNSPAKLKSLIVGLIFSGSVLWSFAIFKIVDFAVYWKYALLLIFTGIIWAIWNKVFFKGNGVLKIIFAISAFSLFTCTILTCFSFLENSDFLFYSLLFFTCTAILIIGLYRNNLKKTSVTP